MPSLAVQGRVERVALYALRPAHAAGFQAEPSASQRSSAASEFFIDLRIAHLRRLGTNRILGVQLRAREQCRELLLLDLERLDARRQRIELALLLVAPACAACRQWASWQALRRAWRSMPRPARRQRLCPQSTCWSAPPNRANRRRVPSAAASPRSRQHTPSCARHVAFEHQRAGDHVVEEVAIMAHQQQRALVLHQQRLEQLERLDVEVVGRLVEHQHVGRPA